MIAAYQQLEIGAETRNVELWASSVGDEFVAASSNSDRVFDKATRIEGLRQSTMRGLSPTPLISGTIYDFPGAAVMISEHVPDRGRPLHDGMCRNRPRSWADSVRAQVEDRTQQRSGGHDQSVVARRRQCHHRIDSSAVIHPAFISPTAE